MKQTLLLVALTLTSCYTCPANTGFSTNCASENTVPSQTDQFDPHWVDNQSDNQIETNYCSKMLLTEDARARLILEIKKRKLHPLCEKEFH